jgi:outer membrane lipopolysaccharide assembly protein LptE/RlpB
MMNNYSYFSNRVLTILSLICISLFAGCYSFTGGSVPDHLKTISLTAVQDNSGFGNPRFRDVLTRRLLDKFRNDNTLVLVESNGDAQLQSTIIRIVDEVVSVSPGEVERERRITVSVEAEYTDYVKRKQVWKRTFSNFQVYLISQGQQAREDAVIAALQQIGEDILLAVVSGW